MMANDRSVRTSLKHVIGELKEIALVATFAAIGIIINIVALQSVVWVFFTYLICLLITALIFGVIDYYNDEIEDDEDENESAEAE